MVGGQPMTSAHDTMNYSDAPAKLDELQASQQQGNLGYNSMTRNG